MASVCPSGLNATEGDGELPVKGLAEQAGVRGIGDIPQPDRAVVAAAGQRVPVGAERDRQEVGGTQPSTGAAVRGWPSGGGARDRRHPTAGPCRRAAAGQRVAVRAERHRVNARRRSPGCGQGRVFGVQQA